MEGSKKGALIAVVQQKLTQDCKAMLLVFKYSK